MTWPQASVAIVVALVGVVPGLLAYFAAKAAVTQGRINEKKTDENTALTLETADTLQASIVKVDEKQAEIVDKTKQIHDLTNSKYDKLQEKLDTSLAQNATLQRLLGQMVDAKTAVDVIAHKLEADEDAASAPATPKTPEKGVG